MWFVPFCSFVAVLDMCHWTSVSCIILLSNVHYWIDWAYLLGRHHQKKECETCFVDISFSACRRIIKSRQISLCLLSFFSVQIKHKERHERERDWRLKKGPIESKVSILLMFGWLWWEISITMKRKKRKLEFLLGVLKNRNIITICIQYKASLINIWNTDFLL
jgi:hypothetical protein